MQSGHIDRFQRRYPHRSTVGEGEMEPIWANRNNECELQERKKKEKKRKMALLCQWIRPSFLQPAIWHECILTRLTSNLKMKTVCSLEMFLSTYSITQWRNPKDHSLKAYCHENLETCISLFICISLHSFIGKHCSGFVVNREQFKTAAGVSNVKTINDVKWCWYLFNYHHF